MNRRSFLQSILAAGVAPYVARAESLMRLRPLSIIVPTFVDETVFTFERRVMDPVACAEMESVTFDMARLPLFRPGDYVTLSLRGFGERRVFIRSVSVDASLDHAARVHVSADVVRPEVFAQPLALVTADEMTTLELTRDYNNYAL